MVCCLILRGFTSLGSAICLMLCLCVIIHYAGIDPDMYLETRADVLDRGIEEIGVRLKGFSAMPL